MAIGGTPVGNMIIKVDLDSAGVEKSMTGLQRQLRSSNKAMGAQLSAFDRSEKSVSKYSVLVEGLTNRKRIQAQMVQEARKRHQEMSETYGENSVKAQQASQQLNEQVARYQETSRELKNVTAEFEEFQRIQDIQSQGWYKVADGMEEWGGKLKSAGQRMDETGQTLTRKVSLPLAAISGMAVKVGSDFEAGMSKVGAVSGASAEEMEQLEKKAREMGATTVFSAKEASDAFYYMSLAGWDAQQSMDGIAGVMDLAAASGEDLALVADIVTDGLTAFGMEAKDAGRMADVLASASANANTDVSGLGQAFQYVAPVAGALGYTIEDTSKAIGLMANAGIKSTKAGTALRTMMTNLTKPTAQAQKEMDKLGISLTDSEGNMKDFDTVMRDLRKSFRNLDKEQQAQAASTIFGKEAMSGALAIVNASEEDYNNLTDAIKNSNGAASEMADIMQDNLQGSLKELRSMVEDLFIEMYQNLKPALESVIDSAKGLTQWFADLSPKTQENIVKFGLLAAAMGPVLSVTGKLTAGVGGLMQGAGALTKVIGMSKGVGLLGALGALSPVAIGGVAVAGLVAIGVAVHELTKDKEELKEVNLDVANSLSEQASSLEASANTFDKLSEKAKISNAELAELNDLNIRISQSSNPAEIEALQRQYDRLAEKSGLSKDELKKLFDANKNIIDQSPEVESSVSNQGNEFVTSTDKVNEYIQSLLELSRQELSDELIIAEEKKRDLLQERISLEQEMADLNTTSSELSDLAAMKEEERNKKLISWKQEIAQKMVDSRITQEELNELQKESELIDTFINEGLGAGLELIQQQREEVRKKQEDNELELQKVNEIEAKMADIVLKQIGINEEGTKGLAVLDETIAKNEQEIEKLDEKKKKNGELTKEEQERYNKLVETNAEHREARDYLHDELGIYKDLNSLAENKLSTAEKTTKDRVESLAKTTDIKVEEGNIIKQLQTKNSEYDKAISKLEKQKKEEGANKAEIDKQIKSLEQKRAQNSAVTEQILRELGVWDDIDDSIKDGIRSEREKGRVTDNTTNKAKQQGNAIDNNNRKTDEGIRKERERTKEAGRSVNKNVKAKDNGTVANITKRARASVSKTVNLRQSGLANLNRLASRPVSKVVNFIAGKIPRFAKGTPPAGHKGGMAIVGDGGGRELVTLPSGQSFLSPDTDTLLNLPRGTHVIPHRKTERIMKSIPKYADGTRNWSSLFNLDSLMNNELMKLLALESRDNNVRATTSTSHTTSNDSNDKLIKLLTEQNAYLKQSNEILTGLLNKDTTVNLDGQKIGDFVDSNQSSNFNLKNYVRG